MSSLLRYTRAWLAAMWPFLAVAALFLCLTLPALEVPRVHPEETDEVLAAWYLLRTPADETHPRIAASLGSVRALGRWLPLREDTSYIGAVELYAQAPFFALFGISATTVRLPPILACLAGILAITALCRRWFGAWTGLAIGALTAAQPVLVHMARLGHYAEEVLTLSFFWCGLYFADRHARAGGGALGSLLAAAFLFGLGLDHKITFLWYLLGMAAVAAVRWRVVGAWVRGHPGHAAAAAAAFTLGCTGLVVYNLTHDGETLRVILSALVQPTMKDSVDNLAYLPNLWVRWRQLYVVILGGWLWDPWWNDLLRGAPRRVDHGLAVAFLVACPLVLAGLVRRRIAPGRGPLLALYAVHAIVFAVSPISVSSLHPRHLLLFYPFPQVVVAVAFAWAVAQAGGRGWARALAAGVVIGFVGIGSLQAIGDLVTGVRNTPQVRYPWRPPDKVLLQGPLPGKAEEKMPPVDSLWR